MLFKLPQLVRSLEWVAVAAATVAASNIKSVHDASFTPDAVLNVTMEQISQSCLPAKWTVLVNGTSPGPELRLKPGGPVWIRVYNSMQDTNLTMHWHGLSMAAAPFSDGTPQVSQWPITAQHFFDYELQIPAEMSGTYFYHSHVGFQAISAAGPLIVEDIVAPYEYDEERTIFISDVYNKTDEEIEKGLTANPFQWSGESSMVTINGNGGGTADGIFCNATLSVINVQINKTYRLRFIGGTAITTASIAIEGHDILTIIEADGSYTQQYNTSYIQIGSGQRFSALLRTKSNSGSGPNTFTIQAETRERPTLTRGYAILNYGTEPTGPIYPPLEPPLSLPTQTYDFLEYVLAPFTPNNFPEASEVTRRIIMTVHQNYQGYITWSENLYPWTEEFPDEPYLVSLYKNDSIEFPSYERALVNNGIDPVTRAFPAMLGEVLEIVIQNTGSDKGELDIHPFHAHGLHFYDIGSGNGTYNASQNEVRLADTNPVERDTTMLYRYGASAPNGTASGWRAWRLRVTQPGAWMVHCHILQHMVMGMQTVWVMGNFEELLSLVPYPEVSGYLIYGGDVNGNITHSPNVVEFFPKI